MSFENYRPLPPDQKYSTAVYSMSEELLCPAGVSKAPTRAPTGRPETDRYGRPGCSAGSLHPPRTPTKQTGGLPDSPGDSPNNGGPTAEDVGGDMASWFRVGESLRPWAAAGMCGWRDLTPGAAGGMRVAPRVERLFPAPLLWAELSAFRRDSCGPEGRTRASISLGTKTFFPVDRTGLSDSWYTLFTALRCCSHPPRSFAHSPLLFL